MNQFREGKIHDPNVSPSNYWGNAVKVDGKNRIFFFKTRKLMITTEFLVRNLLGNSHLEGNGNWNIKLKYV